MIALHRTVGLPDPPGVVWETLWDVPALARCLPGCGDVAVVEERRRYRAAVKDRVGPFTITIPLDVAVESTPPARLGIQASGRDAALGSPVTVGLTVTLEPETTGGTRLTFDGQASVGGKLAALGQGVIERKTRDILDRFATNLRALLKARAS